MIKQQVKNDFGLKGVYKFTLTDINTGEKKEIIYENIVPTVGRSLIANHLVNISPSPALVITYVALGTGTSTPINANTTLQTETYRKAIASRTNASNVVLATGFFDATETIGTYKEAGIFMGGSATANSGTLLSRVSVDITKTNTQTLTIEWTLTIN